MCSYNAIDGTPVASDRELLTEVLRGQFHMPGFVRSDMTAVSRLYGSHYTAKDKPDAIRQGLEAGVDLQLYDFTHDEWAQEIHHLIEHAPPLTKASSNTGRHHAKTSCRPIAEGAQFNPATGVPYPT